MLKKITSKSHKEVILTSNDSSTPTISDKDQKILWSRAAGRCSFEDCRAQLTFDTADSSTKTLGEMCHIVGEKETSPRGKSSLNNKERNIYSNLILLCAHHHRIIDKDEVRYPIEVLHIIKDNHEQWVNDTLGSNQPDPDELVYSELIDSITLLLQLDSWWWFVDNAVRDIVSMEIVDAEGTINRMRLGVLWPKKKPMLKKAIIGLLDAFDEYISYFMTNADIHQSNKFFSPDRSYRRFAYSQYPKYEKYEKKERVWSGICFCLLCNLTIKINRFANAVRRFSNPLYFRTHGKFLIHDSMGYRFGGRDTLFDPSPADIKKGLAKYNYTLKSI